jgi:hypothetical protein
MKYEYVASVEIYEMKTAELGGKSVGATLVTIYFTRTAPGLSPASALLTSETIFFLLLFYLLLYGFCTDMPEDGLSTGRNV